MGSEEDKGGHTKSISSFLSGGLAGVVAKTMIAPIERVKFLFIVTHLIARKTSNRKFTYDLFRSDLVTIVKNHGITNLWRGNIMNIARVFPTAAIDFTVFDFFRTRFYKRDGTWKQQVILYFCGATAGVTSLTLTTPLQFVRVRLAMERDSFSYNNNREAFKTIVSREGFTGFYQGFGAALCGIFVYHGCSFFIFTKLKEAVKQRWPEGYSKWYVDFLIGGFSAIGQIAAYPFDVLRKRMQGQKLLYHKKQISTLSNYKTLIRDIRQKEGGIVGFYKGVSLNLIKAPLSLATVWTVKNHINRILDKNYDL